MHGVGSEVKVLAASKALVRNWFPPNPQLLKSVQEKLESGYYDSRPNELALELQNDISLFLYTLGQLAYLLKNQISSDSLHFNPLALFEQADPETLKAVLRVEPTRVSWLSFEAMDAAQAQRMREALISTQATRVLADQAKLPPGLGYAVAALRQLGYVLIAWNYPHIYRKALEQVRIGANLDQYLLMQLGYTPRMLALKIAQQWRLGSDLLGVLGSHRAISPAVDAASARNRAVAHLVSKMCEVGEALARAAQPDVYPSAREDWSKAERAISAVLGPAGFEDIQREIQHGCLNYLQGTKGSLERLFNVRLEELKPRSTLQPQTVESNTAWESCSSDIRRRLVEIDRRIPADTISQDIIQELMQGLAPKAGFETGYIYIYDPESNSLQARFTLGKPRFSESLIFFSPLMSSDNLVVEAFKSESPVYRLGTDQEERSIAAAIGKVQRVGVLYLEISSGHKARNEQILSTFGALRDVLIRCLHLK